MIIITVFFGIITIPEAECSHWMVQDAVELPSNSIYLQVYGTEIPSIAHFFKWDGKGRNKITTQQNATSSWMAIVPVMPVMPLKITILIEKSSHRMAKVA